MKIKDLEQLSFISYSILNHPDNQYYKNKVFLAKVFKDEDVILRLTLLDAIYSTNSRMNPFVLNDLSEKIKAYQGDLKDDAVKFINDIDSKVSDEARNLQLVDTNTEICNIERSNKKLIDFIRGKYGDKSSHCFSLISKYLFYLTEFKFPIYDRLARDVICRIFNQYYGLHGKVKDISDPIKFFIIFCIINKTSNCNDVACLDNLLWLLCKIKPKKHKDDKRDTERWAELGILMGNQDIQKWRIDKAEQHFLASQCSIAKLEKLAKNIFSDEYANCKSQCECSIT